MKATASQIRRIIREEVANARVARSGRLSEGHSRITSDEMTAWKRGDWGYISETFPASNVPPFAEPESQEPPPEAQEDAERLFCAKMQICGPDEIEYSFSGGKWECSPGLTGVMSHYWDDRMMVWVGIGSPRIKGPNVDPVEESIEVFTNKMDLKDIKYRSTEYGGLECSASQNGVMSHYWDHQLSAWVGGTVNG